MCSTLNLVIMFSSVTSTGLIAPPLQHYVFVTVAPFTSAWMNDILTVFYCFTSKSVSANEFPPPGTHMNKQITLILPECRYFLISWVRSRLRRETRLW